MNISVLGGLRLGPIGFGRVEVIDDRPTAPKQRQLLGLLVLRANETVPVATCLAELWSGDPPRSAATTLQTYVMHLRKILASDLPAAGARQARPQLVTCERGYQLRIHPSDHDLGVVRARIHDGQEAIAAGDLIRGTWRWRDALALWRGPVLADVRTGPVLQQAVAHLEQWRLSIIDQYLDAELRLGRHREVLPELVTLTHRHPLREHMHEALMLALYRSGRQAEALQAYEWLRAALHTELVVPPSRSVEDLQRAIRTGDPRLDLPGPAPFVLSRDLVAADIASAPVDLPAGPGTRSSAPAAPRRGSSRSEATSSCQYPFNVIPS